MPTSCDSVMDEAIQELLRGHINISVDDAGREGDASQYQRLQRESDAFQSQLKILKAAKKATDQACDSKPLDRGQNTSGRRTQEELLYPHMFEPPEYRRIRRRRAREHVSASQQNVAVEADILEWTQKTIQNAIQTLTQEQIEETSEDADREFIPPWNSPTVMGPLFLSGRLQERIAPLEEQIARVRWRQNDLVPIAHLPPEILIKVFAFVLDGFRDNTYVLSTVLTRICRDWTRLIDQTPSLWTLISPNRSTIKQVAMALEKSKPLPISLYLDEDSMDHMPLKAFL
ncbi:hypothetical protein FRC01_003712, partial [Tulasnella sp. 417]